MRRQDLAAIAQELEALRERLTMIALGLPTAAAEPKMVRRWAAQHYRPHLTPEDIEREARAAAAMAAELT